MQSYSELFAQRGASYDLAMRRHPHARRAEFMQILQHVDFHPGMRVGDVPAGGGYLREYLPAHVVLEGHEPCGSFKGRAHGSAEAGNHSLLPLPWNSGELDVVLSLAGIHHLAEKHEFFSEAARVVKPNGIFVLSDVSEGSKVAHFLDGFVGDHNSTGHEGHFLNARTPDELRAAGWWIVSAEECYFCWEFSNLEEMGDFAWNLFHITKTTPKATAFAIEQELGVIELPGGMIGMNWSLMTISCQKK